MLPLIEKDLDRCARTGKFKYERIYNTRVALPMIRFADVYTLKAYGQLRKLMFNLFQDEEELAFWTFKIFLVWGILFLAVFYHKMTNSTNVA